MTEPTTEKLSRRQRLAEVVLFNAPIPHRISFIDPATAGEVGDKLRLTFTSHAELTMWAAVFLPDAEVHSFVDDDGFKASATASGEWGGYPLALYAYWQYSPPPGPLDRDQYDQLLAITNAPADAPPADCCPDAPDAEVTEVGGETVEDAEVAP